MQLPFFFAKEWWTIFCVHQVISNSSACDKIFKQIGHAFSYGFILFVCQKNYFDQIETFSLAHLEIEGLYLRSMIRALHIEVMSKDQKQLRFEFVIVIRNYTHRM